ncbi:outer envelope protein [Massilia sp. Dwa41.01b]|uniref:outer envelope protein n=1 Tax=unclassified Massilia TaxID=2609279 RepID=UPI001603B7D5|nr:MULTISPECIES: outer envelope protein [unclassified Massilia]QNA90688.1 outer envelope protein [Massilia sp. Dwa41.01b]QNA97923.1 outer envelope protein [Massilia sp. Se16.2.3]
MTKTILLSACATFLFTCAGAQAADWSDTSISWRYGTRFAEPFNPTDIKKHIFALTHASGYKYGSNYFNVDLLQSDENDPASLTQSEGAQEAYVVYRHTLDLGALAGRELRFGPVKGVGLTLGVDWNTKNDVGYNSRKRMLVAGPTLMWDVPKGFVNTSILLLRESNAPSGAFPPISQVNGRYTYDTHAMLSVSWALPLAERIAFEGYGNFIGAKGRDETGNPTGAETNVDMALMYDVGSHFGQPKNRFRLGLEYQFWNNKFGNTAATPGGRGQRASTPMVRAEYHF